MKGGQCMKSALDPWVPKCIPRKHFFKFRPINRGSDLEEKAR